MAKPHLPAFFLEHLFRLTDSFLIRNKAAFAALFQKGFEELL